MPSRMMKLACLSQNGYEVVGNEACRLLSSLPMYVYMHACMHVSMLYIATTCLTIINQ